jgi:hypothetical protein
VKFTRCRSICTVFNVPALFGLAAESEEASYEQPGCLCHHLIVADFVILVKQGKCTSQMHSESFSGVSIKVLTSNYFFHCSQIAAVSITY